MQRVLELDSGRAKELPLQENIAVQKIEEEEVSTIAQIVTPTSAGCQMSGKPAGTEQNISLSLKVHRLHSIGSLVTVSVNLFQVTY